MTRKTWSWQNALLIRDRPFRRKILTRIMRSWARRRGFWWRKMGSRYPRLSTSRGQDSTGSRPRPSSSPTLIEPPRALSAAKSSRCQRTLIPTEHPAAWIEPEQILARIKSLRKPWRSSNTLPWAKLPNWGSRLRRTRASTILRKWSLAKDHRECLQELQTWTRLLLLRSTPETARSVKISKFQAPSKREWTWPTFRQAYSPINLNPFQGG